ncbi:hypothetical protein E3N88_14781 [Mikania micrantha]|uniref:Aminotransferase-like plant mobile domain-containing protein n=1 Tax=Mikania micrantha TaxID=192012 RepID=A0A5N6P452_9ASTR|nr:hypothetical protein E3N88_14781 [Mikania micrantha]
MSYDLHPGPIIDDVLFLKDSHRARDIFYNRELTKLVFRRADQKFFLLLNNNPITNNVKRYINIAGFGGLSWGSAVLAMLYRNLCKATSSSAKNIGGPLYILQLWAWSRITTIAPRILHPFDNRRPYGAMYGLKFKWRPYEEVISFIPEICISGSHSWQSECYLIYWDVVEFYTPQRVMRQFGMVQNIPRPVPTSINEHMTLHTLTRSGKPEKNWMNIHSEYVSVWNQRWQNVIQGVRCATPTVEPNYMQWFWSRTVLYITNPKSQEVIQPGFQDHGSRSQFLMDVISQTYRQAGDFMQTESTSNFQNFESLQNTANQVMGMLNEESRLHYPSHLQTGPANLGGDETVPHSLRMRERRCGNVRSGADTSNVQHENCQDGTSNVRSGADTSSGISSLPSLDLNL